MNTHANQAPKQISQEQLQEQIQKLIKNNKKHFSKDKEAEELHKYLKQVIHQHLDANNSGMHDQNNVNELINELIKINQPH